MHFITKAFDKCLYIFLSEFVLLTKKINNLYVSMRGCCKSLNAHFIEENKKTDNSQRDFACAASTPTAKASEANG